MLCCANPQGHQSNSHHDVAGDHHSVVDVLALVLQDLHRFTAIVGNFHRRAFAFEKLNGDLLVDFVVLGQQHANAVQPAKRNTCRYGAPGPSARPAMYAATIPTSTQ